MPTTKAQKPKPPKADKPRAKAQSETVGEVKMEAVIGAVGLPPGKAMTVRLEIPLSSHISDHMIGTLRRLQGEVVTVKLTAKQLDAFRSNQERNAKPDTPKAPAGEKAKAPAGEKAKAPATNKGKPGTIPSTATKDLPGMKKRATPPGFGAGE